MNDESHGRSATGSMPRSRLARGALATWQLQAALICLTRKTSLRAAVRDAVQACGISREHFSRAFKISTGMSPSRWHIEQRLDRAQELLANSDLPLAAVAIQCGFADQSHFTNALKRLRQQSPGSYRRSLLK